jgi:hypothetical protein
MENKFLQRQMAESTLYYLSERRRYKKIKTNIFLVVSILGISISVRLKNDSPNSNINESTNQQYFDIPPHQVSSRFNLSQIA